MSPGQKDTEKEASTKWTVKRALEDVCTGQSVGMWSRAEIPKPMGNCPPQNRCPVPRRLGTTGLEHGAEMRARETENVYMHGCLQGSEGLNKKPSIMRELSN